MDNAGLESMDVMGPLESVGGCEGRQQGGGGGRWLGEREGLLGPLESVGGCEGGPGGRREGRWPGRGGQAWVLTRPGESPCC